MPKLTIVDSRGMEHVIAPRSGVSLMQAIVNNQIEGVLAECGGACACGTCHCYIDPQWANKMPSIMAIEKETLEFSIGVEETSRLSCQIKLTDEMEGLL